VLVVVGSNQAFSVGCSLILLAQSHRGFSPRESQGILKTCGKMCEIFSIFGSYMNDVDLLRGGSMGSLSSIVAIIFALFLLVFGLELVCEREFGSLFLELGKLVLVFGDLLECGLDELALHVRDGHVELVDLEVSEDDFSLQEEHFSFQVVPLVEVVLDDLFELVFAGVLDVLLGSAALADDPLALGRFPLLFLLQLLGGLLSQQSPQLLLALGGHESLLLSHCAGCLVV